MKTALVIGAFVLADILVSGAFLVWLRRGGKDDDAPVVSAPLISAAEPVIPQVVDEISASAPTVRIGSTAVHAACRDARRDGRPVCASCRSRLGVAVPA